MKDRRAEGLLFSTCSQPGWIGLEQKHFKTTVFLGGDALLSRHGILT
jgi:hypothetical protein